MNKTTTKKYEKQLRAMAVRLDGTVAGLEHSVRTPVGGEGDGGLSGAPLHLADLGTEAHTQEVDSALLENETYLRDEIAAALGRVDGGTYGGCERCGKAVPAARLDALPYTRYCTACSAAVRDGVVVNVNHGTPPVAFALGSNPTDTHAAGTPGGGAAGGGLAGAMPKRASRRATPAKRIRAAKPAAKS